MSVGRGILMSSFLARESDSLYALCNIDLTRVDIRDILTRALDRLSHTNNLVIPLE